MSNIPPTMTVAMAHDFADIRLESMATPQPGPGEALVKVRALGLCMGDVTPWYVHKKAPLVIGHEPTGQIVQLGAGVEGFKVGDRVYFHHHAPCLKCRHCQNGNYVMCQTWRDSKIIPGGAAQYCLVPANNLDKDTLLLPDSMSYAEGTLIEPLACVVRAFRRVHMRSGDRVVILGLGVMGQMMAVLARHLGASQIIASDCVPFRLEHAKKLGVDRLVDFRRESLPQVVAQETNGEKADVVFVCPTTPEAFLEGIECAGRSSRVLLFMGPAAGTKLTVDMNKIYFDEIDLLSSYSCGPDDTREALRLIEAGVSTAPQMITHHFPLERIQEAVDLSRKAQDSLKIIIDID